MFSNEVHKEEIIMETKTTLGLPAGLVIALLYVGTYFGGALFLAVAIAYIALKETNALVKANAKTVVIIYLIVQACNLLVDFIDDFASLCSVYSDVYSTVMSKLNGIISIAYLVVMVVFAIIGLVKGLPQAPRPVYTQQPQAQAQPQGTRTCPGCQTLLAGPGICPKCGTKVD